MIGELEKLILLHELKNNKVTYEFSIFTYLRKVVRNVPVFFLYTDECVMVYEYLKQCHYK